MIEIMRICPLVWTGLLAAAVLPSAQADNFVSAHYKRRSDSLVITVRYRGTNPHHTFSVRWGTCQAPSKPPSLQQISAVILDDQWKDENHRSSWTKARAPPAYTAVDLQLGYQSQGKWLIAVDGFNLADIKWNDIEYHFVSRLQSETNATPDYVAHPGVPRTVRALF
jgi:hypothetical protein